MDKRINKYLYYTITFLAIFIIQQLASKMGGLVANIFSYKTIDPYNLFAFISVHHIMILIIAFY